MNSIQDWDENAFPIFSVVTWAAFVLMLKMGFSQLFHYFRWLANTVRGKEKPAS